MSKLEDVLTKELNTVIKEIESKFPKDKSQYNKKEEQKFKLKVLEKKIDFILIRSYEEGLEDLNTKASLYYEHIGEVMFNHFSASTSEVKQQLKYAERIADDLQDNYGAEIRAVDVLDMFAVHGLCIQPDDKSVASKAYFSNLVT